MRLAILIAVASTALLAAATATAAPPEHFPTPWTIQIALPARASPISSAVTKTCKGITTFDAQGNPVMDVVHIKGSELYRRSGSSDTYTVYFSFTFIYDYASDVASLKGQVIRVNYPGLGVLFHDVGNIIHYPGDVDVIHGPHDAFEQGQNAYCNAFLAIASG